MFIINTLTPCTLTHFKETLQYSHLGPFLQKMKTKNYKILSISPKIKFLSNFPMLKIQF